MPIKNFNQVDWTQLEESLRNARALVDLTALAAMGNNINSDEENDSICFVMHQVLQHLDSAKSAAFGDSGDAETPEEPTALRARAA